MFIFVSLFCLNIWAASATSSEVGPAVIINRTVDFSQNECLAGMIKVNAASKTYSCNLSYGAADLSVKFFDLFADSQKYLIIDNCKVILQFGQSTLKAYVSHNDNTVLDMTEAKKCFAYLYKMKIANDARNRSFKALVVF